MAETYQEPSGSGEHCPLGRASSLVFNSQTPSVPSHDGSEPHPTRRNRLVDMVRKLDSENEVIPDSEEERNRERRKIKGRARKSFVDEEIIELFSSSDDDQRPQALSMKSQLNPNSTPKPALPWSATTADPIPPPSTRGASPTKKFRLPQTPRTRRIVYSSDEEAESLLNPTPIPPAFSITSRRSLVPQDVIEISDSEPEVVVKEPKPPTTALPKATTPPLDTQSGIEKKCLAKEDGIVPPTEGEDLSELDDGSILVFYEPRSARKPIPRKPTLPKPKPRAPSRADSGYFTPSSYTLEIRGDKSSVSVTADPTPLATPTISRIRSELDPFATPSSSSTTLPTTTTPTGRTRKTPAKPKTPRVTKKAVAAAERARLDKYAHDLFDELNRTVFDGGMPEETELVWNSRLLTTAGKARYHKPRDGPRTVQIELAPKVLDCEERIRHTLSHEMCHLASWLISDKIDENHGRVFRSWGKRVMRIRSDIEVSTRHDYDISYRYEWKCATCAKIYGRHSKSIRPDEVACGACHKGRLVPLFTTRAPKTPKKTQNSNNAGPSRDSPRTVTQPLDIIELGDSDEDVHELTEQLNTIGIISLAE